MIALLIPLALATGNPSPTSPYTQDEILHAIRIVESGGHDSCPDGDGGRSIGPFQISRAYWMDALKSDRSIGGTYQNCRRRDYARRVVQAFMKRYAANAWKNRDVDTIARIHNGGPRGHRKRATLSYARRVQKELELRYGAARME